jgi:hypothetical protein
MSLSISRDLSNLTPEQQIVVENIAKANRILKDYADSLDREELPMWLTQLIIRVFTKGDEDFMNEAVLVFLKTVMEETTLEDVVYKKAADAMKETIPGTQYEPIIGEIMVGLGTELKKPEQVK